MRKGKVDLSAFTEGKKGQKDSVKVLLLSPSRVVREMVRLATEKAHAKLECVEDLSQVREDHYDFLLVDEHASHDVDSMKEHLIVGTTVLIHSPENLSREGYDHSVAKPFLPSDILRIVESRQSESKVPEESFTLDDFTTAVNGQGTRVLDGEEIAKIRSILIEESEGESEEMSSIEGVEEKGEEALSFPVDPVELIGYLRSLKPKKLKKLLEGAEVTITLRFPKKGES